MEPHSGILLTVGGAALNREVEVRILVPELNGGSSNGRTRGFGPRSLGSNPSPPASLA
jgi:hypothetical protein